MADLSFACWQCQGFMAAGPELAGVSVGCPHCQAVMGAAALVEELSFAAKPQAARMGNDKRQNWAAVILGPYAVLMTLLAVMFYVRAQASEANHPLSNIPDLDGLYRNTTHKTKSTSEHRTRFDPDTKLYDSMITLMGQTIAMGDLQVTPIVIEQRPITAFILKKGQSEPVKESSDRAGLILKVRLTNLSNDVSFYPTDPYFSRRIDEREGRSYQHVEAGSRRIYGGVLRFPPTSETLVRQWVEGQENDNQPLGPKESRVTVIAAPPRAATAVREAQEKCVWRLQFRRGFVPFRDKEYAVSAVIGVQFDPSEVIR